MDKLLQVQAELRAPKNQRNNFGNYNYRSCEDILEAVKPLLLKHGLTMTITDDIVEIDGRVYVKATVNVYDGTKYETVSAFAREAETKKGMDEAQITGAASSYARKYALNGMFLIDDNKDADTMPPEKTEPKQQPKPNTKSAMFSGLINKIKSSNFDDATMAQLQERYAMLKTSEDGKALEAEVDKLIMLQKKFVDDPVPEGLF